MNAAQLAQAVALSERQEIGHRVKAARLAAGTGRLRLARSMNRVGFDSWLVNTIVRIEAGQRRLQTLEAQALAELLGCASADLGVEVDE